MIELKVEIDGDLNVMMAEQVRTGQRAVSAAMRAAGAGLKATWRAQIAGAGLGNRLANTIRDQSYPKGQPSLNAAALVWSKAPKIVDAHERGALIRSKDGFWLAIPTASAGRGKRGGKVTPGEWEQRTGRRLRFVYRKGRSGLLVDDGTVRSGNAPAFGQRAKRGFRNRTVPIFILVPQVKLRKRLDLMGAAKAAHAALPGQIIAAWRGARAQ